MKAADLKNSVFSQSLIRIAFPEKCRAISDYFHSRSTEIRVAFESEDNTVNPEAETLADTLCVLRCVTLRFLDYVFIHRHFYRSPRLFCRRKNAPASWRRDTLRGATWAGFRDPRTRCESRPVRCSATFLNRRERAGTPDLSPGGCLPSSATHADCSAGLRPLPSSAYRQVLLPRRRRKMSNQRRSSTSQSRVLTSSLGKTSIAVTSLFSTLECRATFAPASPTTNVSN